MLGKHVEKSRRVVSQLVSQQADHFIFHQDWEEWMVQEIPRIGNGAVMMMDEMTWARQASEPVPLPLGAEVRSKLRDPSTGNLGGIGRGGRARAGRRHGSSSGCWSWIGVFFGSGASNGVSCGLLRQRQLNHVKDGALERARVWGTRYGVRGTVCMYSTEEQPKWLGLWMKCGCLSIRLLVSERTACQPRGRRAATQELA
jgi:hypothetical protein